jgi:predicted DNA-binding transcriptional regulator AlpA
VGLVLKKLFMKTESTFVKPGSQLLFTCDPEDFWREVRRIIKEEVSGSGRLATENADEEPPMGSQSLYKIKDLCRIFSVSKPTIYEWIRIGKLHPRRIKRRVFFLEKDLKELLG